MKAVVLTRKQVVEASYYLHEAERSLHHVLNPACRWQDFQAYYTPEKVAALQRFAHVFQIPGREIPTDFPAVQQLTQWHRPPGVLLQIVGACIGRFRSHWRIAPAEAAFVAGVFSGLLRLLAEGAKPDADRLIAASRSSCGAHQILESRCCGLDELKTVRQKINWFNRLSQQPTPTVAEILCDVA